MRGVSHGEQNDSWYKGGIMMETDHDMVIQARKEEIKRINNANEYDIGSIGNYDPDEG